MTTPKVKKHNIILDSGAYSAWRGGKEVDVQNYIQFLHQIKDQIYGYFNLDVIPKGNTRIANQEHLEDAAKKSWKNLVTMRKAGLMPIPVYHRDERFYWLEKMVNEGFPYISISLNIYRREISIQKWLDSVFNYLCSRNHGCPPVRIHGLGIGKPEILTAYPWHSVDCTTWLLMAVHTRVMLPKFLEDGTYDYARSCSVMTFGTRLQAQSMSNLHYHNAGPEMQEMCNRYFESHGMTAAQIMDDTDARAKMNLIWYSEMSKALKVKPYHVEHKPFLFRDTDTMPEHHADPLSKLGRIKIFVVMSGSMERIGMLSGCENLGVLYSFYMIRTPGMQERYSGMFNKYGKGPLELQVKKRGKRAKNRSTK